MRKCYEIISKSARVGTDYYGVYIKYNGITRKFPVSKKQYDKIDLKTSLVTLSRNESGRKYIDRVLNKKLSW